MKKANTQTWFVRRYLVAACIRSRAPNSRFLIVANSDWLSSFRSLNISIAVLHDADVSFWISDCSCCHPSSNTLPRGDRFGDLLSGDSFGDGSADAMMSSPGPEGL